ncbi:hypothetical protein GOFOIKOB_1734 [Methylobacterium tardum]|uniref:Uncharacterized protein n=1 Tax=Methylobacterium tardum TaxID=374432 RepID=A0AA37TIY1_9HYPH|nr:hypothetical protein [Methylobacterium tardum]URD39644.1 hypothetical protein M6G65_15385 [Methylobacterium tardum]GJE48702.1 hypothetical protein GOFOIKOB_1734 [Methylobacterium tardum]GLS72405.1 hypothetical protein GCM10007890_44200 [Methylobacterium tardum]
MEANDLKQPPFRVLTFRDGQQVIAEDVETEVAARTRFASAVDLCKTRDDAHGHHVELHAGSEVLDRWSSADA